MIVTIQDIRDAGYCARGAREWAKRHGYDFKLFIINGMPIETLDAHGDEFCLRVAEHVRKKNGVSNG